MRQYMVRILRSTDDDWADVVVNAKNEHYAKALALYDVSSDPESWFGDPAVPTYYLDDSTEVEDVTDGGEYISANQGAGHA